MVLMAVPADTDQEDEPADDSVKDDDQTTDTYTPEDEQP